MGATNTIKQILIDKHMNITQYAELLEKPKRTVVNTFMTDNFRVSNLLTYLDRLDCELIVRDMDNGREYKIYP